MFPTYGPRQTEGVSAPHINVDIHTFIIASGTIVEEAKALARYLKLKR